MATQQQSRYAERPAECWVSNRKINSLSMAFFEKGGLCGTPRLPDGTLDVAQESGGWVGTYAPDAQTAKQWQAEELASTRTRTSLYPR